MATEINNNRLKRFITLAGSDKFDDWMASFKMNMSTDEFAEVAEHASPKVIRMLMRHPNVPVEVLAKGAKAKNVGVRRVVMENPNTPADILAEGAKDPDEDVRAAILGNPNTPIEVLYKGLEDNEPVLRLLAEQMLREREKATEIENNQKLDDGKCIYYFEQSFDNFDYLHTLASRHAKVPEGVLNYWAEKLEPLINDYELLRAEARLAPLFRKGR